MRLHPLLAERFSPMRFDPTHVPSSEELRVLLTAARNAPSAGNSQPWRFIVGVRGGSVHSRLCAHLARSSAEWAPSASYLVANLRQRTYPGSTMEYSEFGRYDLGQAVAHMTVQAQALGLAAHQFRAFDRDALHRECEVPAHLEIVTMTAFGRADHERGEVVGSGTDRSRLDVDALVLEGDAVSGAGVDRHLAELRG